jgi:hypothetical protein
MAWVSLTGFREARRFLKKYISICVYAYILISCFKKQVFSRVGFGPCEIVKDPDGIVYGTSHRAGVSHGAGPSTRCACSGQARGEN